MTKNIKFQKTTDLKKQQISIKNKSQKQQIFKNIKFKKQQIWKNR